jgi:hypothetical protein
MKPEIILMAKKKNILSQQTVGPSTVDLKSRFKERSIPLETDFAALIDVADCGRKAVGLSPDFDPADNTGLILDSNSQLKVLPDANKGIKVDVSGVGVVVDSYKGIKVDESGVGVVVESNKGIKVDTFGIGLIPEQLFVSGMIMMFSGSTAPAGWAFCDGNNGRPNLINKFIMGGAVSDANQYGGATISGSGKSKTYTVTTSLTGVGDIDVTIGNTELGIAQIPAHQHISGVAYRSYQDDGNWAPYGAGALPWNNYSHDVNGGGGDDHASPYTNMVGNGEGHNHAATASSDSTHSHDIVDLPAYYILAFIIKL